MASWKLDKHLETKSKDELEQNLLDEQKRQKLWLILLIVTAALFVIGVLVMLFTSLTNPLIGIVTFLLFLVSFMLYFYSRQNVEELRSLLNE